MTNEELVALIQAGERDRMGELWQNVERFVWQQAHQRTQHGAEGVTVEDLYQSGYLALVDAANSYDPERAMSFIGWLALSLKTAFNAAAGKRSVRQRRDPLHHAVSVDAPAYLDEAGPTVAEIVPDESAALAFAVVECEDCRKVIAAALDSLPDGQGRLLRRYYLRGIGADAAAAGAGYASRYAAYEAIGRALYRLAHGEVYAGAAGVSEQLHRAGGVQVRRPLDRCGEFSTYRNERNRGRGAEIGGPPWRNLLGGCSVTTQNHLKPQGEAGSK